MQRRGRKAVRQAKGFGGGRSRGEVRGTKPREVADGPDGVVFAGLMKSRFTLLQKTAERIEEAEGLEMGR